MGVNGVSGNLGIGHAYVHGCTTRKLKTTEQPKEKCSKRDEVTQHEQDNALVAVASILKAKRNKKSTTHI